MKKYPVIMRNRRRVTNSELMTDIMRFVREHQARENKSPTYREIQKGLGLSTLSLVQRYVKILVSHGDIETDGSGKIALDERFDAGRMNMVPLLGEVPCGPPIEAVEDFEAMFRLPEGFIGPDEHYMLRAEGDSMEGAGIRAGDLLLIRRQDYAEPGQIVVALVGDNESTVKRYLPQKRSVILRPENPRYADIVVDRCAILGVVDGYFHRF